MDIRNIAIIAHVDHGKTSLVDCMLKASGTVDVRSAGSDLIMDSNPQERERGITIFSKNCAIRWKGVKINVIDTPGHADFGGEVERVLMMADAVLLVVDAFEGPMPQTRYVLRKALEAKLRPIVVINKIDRPEARPAAVLDEIYGLLIDLGADESLLDVPVLYSSAKLGFARRKPEDLNGDITPLLDEIIKSTPRPTGSSDAPLQLQITTLDYNDYVGRIGVGRLYNGALRQGQRVMLAMSDGRQVPATVDLLYSYEGLGRMEVKEVTCGDIAAVAGLADIHIGDTLTDLERPMPREPIHIDEPTVTMLFSINTSPFVGREGSLLTSRHVRDRLMKELQTNVALRVEPTDVPDQFKVSGRGLLHLGVVVETMRREGFELMVGKPHVIYREINGETCEPIEYLEVDVPPSQSGPVIELVGMRRGEMVHMDQKESLCRMEFTIPARGLIGMRTRLMNATRGEAIMHHVFHEYQPSRGAVPRRANGVMVSMERGRVTAYALQGLADRGTMFVSPGDEVYAGQIVGEHCKDDDIEVNVCRQKKLTNIRAASADKTVVLKPPRDMSLETMLEYIEDDEWVEATPKSCRLRKRILDANLRKRASRQPVG